LASLLIERCVSEFERKMGRRGKGRRDGRGSLTRRIGRELLCEWKGRWEPLQERLGVVVVEMRGRELRRRSCRKEEGG
jgi:hypothetical protein